jgi:hypothetical protein
LLFLVFPYCRHGDDVVVRVAGRWSGEGSWRSGRTRDTYKGGTARGKFHGRGLYTFASGGLYDGEYKVRTGRRTSSVLAGDGGFPLN